MQRKMFDCRDLPGECTLAIEGEQHEVVEAQVLHSVQIHGQKDSAELRGPHPALAQRRARARLRTDER